MSTPYSGDGYTIRPTHLRVFTDGREWFIDGSDGDGFTESCWSYDSFHEALAALPKFVQHNEAHNGVRFDWRNAR
jgi:hypothetical protein